MDRHTKLFSTVALMAMVMGLSVVASAQWRSRRGTTGSYGNTNYNANIDSTIRSLKSKSERFEDLLDRVLDESRYDGSNQEDRINELAKKFKDAVDDLDDEYDNRDDYNKSRDEAQRVLSIGSQLDRALSNLRVNRNISLRSSWNSIESDLRTLSRAYNISYQNSRTNRNRNDRTRNNRKRGNDDRNGNTRGNNDRYNRNRTKKRNNNRYRGNLRSTIANLRNKSKRFEKRLDKRKKNSKSGRYGNRNQGDLKKLADRFDDAVKKLEKAYRNKGDYNRSRDEARRVLSLGQQLDRRISRARVNRGVKSDWNRIEQDLRTISRAYNLNYNGRTSSSRINDIRSRFPF